MRGRTRAAGMLVASALGAGAAIAVAAGGEDVRACVTKRTGELYAAARDGRCGPGAFAITIGGKAFKKGARGGTLTINGVAFKRSAGGRTLTINGTAFKGAASRRTLTINGTAFEGSSIPRTLTINGTSFKTSGQTLTINGTTFAPGPASAPGPAGPPGPQGPPGPAGTLSGPAPTEVGGPIALKPAAGQVTLAGAGPFHAPERRRLLITGGFTTVCDSCRAPVDGDWALERDGSAVVRRRLDTLSTGEAAGVGFSEVVVTPGACGPCDFRLVGSAFRGSGQIDVSDIRIAVVDLGNPG